jgi:hypothetical protein
VISAARPATAEKWSAGALALGDADADGDRDLFVAGRITPARYPEAVPSVFLRNDGGSFTNLGGLNRAFQSLGMISAATWSDLNQDGKPELLLATDGGPLRVFTLDKDRFQELTAALGLDQLTGWWQSIATGDFNNDGRMDIVAGNLGRNSKYQKFISDGYALYYGEFEADGRMLILESYRDRDLGKVVPLMDRDSLAMDMPHLKERFPTFASFSTASVEDILGTRPARVLAVNTTESLLFLNEGTRFRATPLPLQAQFSPLFGIAIGDVDADGNEDIAITQNLFSVGKFTSRYDAGEGLLMLGDGKGNLAPVAAAISGIKMDAEGRGAAFCDFDHDGRLDLVAAQNSAATKLYRNQSPRSGLRLSLRGDELNPIGIGVTLRLRFPDGRFGPAHEIRAGEGYWSQSGSTVVLGNPQNAREVEVLWPGGRRELFSIPNGQSEYVIEKRK